MACYDYRKEKKRIEALAAIWEKNTGQKTIVFEHLTGTRKWYTFEVVTEPDGPLGNEEEVIVDG